MNFRKLPKEKRNELVMVALLALLALGGLGFGLIKWQYQNLSELDRKKDAAHQMLRRVQETVRRSDEVEAEFTTLHNTLSNLEDGMASGDYLSSVVNTIRNFKLPYKVEIPAFSQPLAADMNLLGKFPYQQVTVTIGGQAYYHDLGKFIADFENNFPHIRIVNLGVEPLSKLMDGDKGKLDTERLNFTMDVVTLVKPTRQN